MLANLWRISTLFNKLLTKRSASTPCACAHTSHDWISTTSYLDSAHQIRVLVDVAISTVTLLDVVISYSHEYNTGVYTSPAPRPCACTCTYTSHELSSTKLDRDRLIVPEWWFWTSHYIGKRWVLTGTWSHRIVATVVKEDIISTLGYFPL